MVDLSVRNLFQYLLSQLRKSVLFLVRLVFTRKEGIAVFLDALKLMPSSILSKVCIKTYGFNSLDQISLFVNMSTTAIDQHQINEILASVRSILIPQR